MAAVAAATLLLLSLSRSRVSLSALTAAAPETAPRGDTARFAVRPPSLLEDVAQSAT